jgi:trimeric autotransporter adhesin
MALDSDALFAGSTGSDNTAVGYAALLMRTPAAMPWVGRSALGANTNGTGNTAVGKDAALLVVTGAYNVAVGWTALDAATTSNNSGWRGRFGRADLGSANTAIGFQAGNALCLAAETL